MPELSLLEKYLDSLKQDRAMAVAKIDSEISEVEEILRRHSANGASPPLHQPAPRRPTPTHPNETRVYPTDLEADDDEPSKPPRLPFSRRYPDVSLNDLIVQALGPAHGLDRDQLQAQISKMGFSYGGKALDTALRRMRAQGRVRKMPLPLGRRQGKLKNLWDLVRHSAEERWSAEER
jgi:hypothetical protein